VRAISCYMNSGGADISEVLTLTCSSDGSWALESLDVEEVPYDFFSGGRRRGAPRLEVVAGGLTAKSFLYSSEASNLEPGWELEADYYFNGSAFEIERIEVSALGMDR